MACTSCNLKLPIVIGDVDAVPLYSFVKIPDSSLRCHIMTCMSWPVTLLHFWNSLAALPAGSIYHTVCLDNLTDAFGGGACNMASSLAGCLNSVGCEEEEEEFYKLLPANKADHLCQLWQSCSDLHKIQTVYDIVENPHLIRLSKK